MQENRFGAKSKVGGMREQAPQRWVLASHNLHKAAELGQMLGPYRGTDDPGATPNHGGP